MFSDWFYKSLETPKKSYFAADAFFCDLNIPPLDTYPKTKISQKQKHFFGKIALNLYQKITKTKGNSFEQKILTPDLSKNKGNSFEQKIPPPRPRHTYPRSVKKTKVIPLNTYPRSVKKQRQFL